MCDYCEKGKSLFWHESYKLQNAVKEVYIELDGSITVDLFNESALNMKIDYCPICGRKLGGE